jgi:hypothetical protein
MRSGSTLLQHLVGQQSDVLSAGETKIEYKAQEDLARLKSYLKEYNNLEEENAGPFRYLDKCVHNRYFPRPIPQTDHTIRYLFLLRDPVPAMSSLLELEGWPYAESKEAAAWYYTDRFKALVDFAGQLGNPQHALFLNYEELLQEPREPTRRISQFLKCKTPLSTDYPKQRWTAKLSLGDVSDNIKTSKIVPNRRKELVELDKEMATSLKALHHHTRDKLKELCRG